MRFKQASAVAVFLPLILSGCLGSSSDDAEVSGSPAAYNITTSASSNGSISPSSRSVNAGASTTFTLIPQEGYKVGEISGCAGSLSGNEYTTAVISAACTLQVTFDERIKLSTVSFKDSNLDQCVINSGLTYVDELETLECVGKSVGSAEGVELLTALTTLNLSNNTLGSVNVSKNIALTSLKLVNTGLTSIDVSKNIALKELYLGTGQVSKVVVGGLKVLASTTPSLTNQITDIDLSNNTEIEVLDLSNNNLTSLNLSKNIQLKSLNLSNNNLTSIDLSNNETLTELDLRGNQVTSVDLSNNLKLADVQLDSTAGCTGDNCPIKVSGTAGDNGSISPLQVVINPNTTTTFTLTPATNYEVDTVSGCNGALSGNSYTTGTVNATCTVNATFKLKTHVVSTHSAGNGSIFPTSAVVSHGALTTFTLNPAANYEIDSVNGCNGSLSGNEYTTSSIEEVCTVNTTFKAITHAVTASASENGSITPVSTTVHQGSTTTFSLTPDANYEVDTVNGCDGSLSGNQYTTAAISDTCEVSATFKHITHAVNTSVSGDGSMTPESSVVNQGSTLTLTLTPAENYEIDTVSGCNGSLSDNTYTTAAVIGACTVSASFKAITHIVTASAGENGSISPNSTTVNQGSTTTFTLTPEDNYEIDRIDGCNGSLLGNEYKTGEITEACTVSASFKAITHAVTTTAGENGSISPISMLVNQGTTGTFALTADEGYEVDTISGCNGSLSGNEYIIGEATEACTIAVSFKVRSRVADITFEDANFRQCVLDSGIEFVSDLTRLVCSNQSIEAASGVEELTALTYLDLSMNQLSSIDLSNNTALTEVYLWDNQLVSIDTPASATILSLSINQLRSIDVSNNTALTFLDLSYNQLNSIDLSNNTALAILALWKNQLSSIDLSNNIALAELILSENQLTSLDVSNNISLNSLNLGINQLSSLDVSNNTKLTLLALAGNQLSTIDLSNNTALTSLSLVGNRLRSIDISSNTALTRLSLTNNQLTNIDVANNIELTNLELGSNSLIRLDVTNNIALVKLSLSGSQVSSLDVSQNTALTYLAISSKKLTRLDVSQNTALTNLIVFNSQVSSLDVSQNIALTSLRAEGNQLSSIDLTNNPDITTLKLDSGVACLGTVCSILGKDGNNQLDD